MPWWVRETIVSRAHWSVGVPSCPTPPRHPAVRRPTRPARGMFGFWVRKVLDSTSRVFFIRASRDTPWRSFFRRLDGKRRFCGKSPSASCAARPRPPARPSRLAVRRPVPTCSRYVRVLNPKGTYIGCGVWCLIRALDIIYIWFDMTGFGMEWYGIIWCFMLSFSLSLSFLYLFLYMYIYMCTENNNNSNILVFSFIFSFSLFKMLDYLI